MKYDKFQSLLMNRHTKCEDVMKKIDAWGKGLNFCLKCGGNPNQEQFFIIYVGFWP